MSTNANGQGLNDLGPVSPAFADLGGSVGCTSDW